MAEETTNRTTNPTTRRTTTTTRAPGRTTASTEAAASPDAKQQPESASQGNEKAEEKTAQQETEKQEEEKIPTLEEDYEVLKNMNLLRDVLIRMQCGKYPNKKLEGVLSRRMKLDEEKLQSPRIVRIIITIMAMFFICTLTYIAIWLTTATPALHGVREFASMVISMFFIGFCAFAVFNNLSAPDEVKVQQAIKERMTEIEVELNISKKSTSSEKEKTEKEAS